MTTKESGRPLRPGTARTAFWRVLIPDCPGGGNAVSLDIETHVEHGRGAAYPKFQDPFKIVDGGVVKM